MEETRIKGIKQKEIKFMWAFIKDSYFIGNVHECEGKWVWDYESAFEMNGKMCISWDWNEETEPIVERLVFISGLKFKDKVDDERERFVELSSVAELEKYIRILKSILDTPFYEYHYCSEKWEKFFS